MSAVPDNVRAKRRDTQVHEGAEAKQNTSDTDVPRRCCSRFWCFCCLRCKRRRAAMQSLEDKPLGEEWDEDMGGEVPEVFLDWLTATFKPRSNSGPGFHSKSVYAKRIISNGAGLHKEPPLVLNDQVSRFLKDFNNWNFDLFKLHEMTQGLSLRVVVAEVFRRYNITTAFSINATKLEYFLDALVYGYSTHKCAYHNETHACEVVHSVHCFLQLSGITRFYTDVQIFALLFAAIIHDFEHSGKTNTFHINAQTDLAILYNDNSVQENHHLSSAFHVLKISQCNIVSDMTDDEYREFRRLVIELVLNTDMTYHFQQLKLIRGHLKTEKWQRKDENAIEDTMSLILHAADISNPGKAWNTHKLCADAILREFFSQGDEEKKRGLPITPLCDRTMTDIPRTQVTFIEVIVEPCLTVLGEMFDYTKRWDTEDMSLNAKDRRKSRGVKKLTKEYHQEGELQLTRRESGSPFIYRRPWIYHLQQNKAKWIQDSIRAAKPVLTLTQTGRPQPPQ